MNQRGFFAADERAGPHLDDHLEREVRTQDVVAQKVVRLRFGDRDAQTGDRQRIFGSNVDIRFLSADGVGGQRHPFEEAVRVAFDDRAVHKRTRVAFVGVADQVTVGFFVGAREHPFASGGEPAAAASAQTAFEDLFADVVGRNLFGQGLFQRAVTAAGDIFFKTSRIHQTAVGQNPTGLRGEERMFVDENGAVPGGGLFIAVLPHHMIGDDFALIDDRVENRGGRVFCHLLERDPVLTGKLNVDDRLDSAQTDAADFDDIGVKVVFLHERFHGFQGIGGAGAQTARSGSDVERRLFDIFPPEDRKFLSLLRRQIACIAQSPGKKFSVKRFYLFHFISLP